MHAQGLVQVVQQFLVESWTVILEASVTSLLIRLAWRQTTWLKHSLRMSAELGFKSHFNDLEALTGLAFAVGNGDV